MAKTKKKVGAFAGKFLPPHIGHITQIERAAEYCDKLYVVVADNELNSKNLCKLANIPEIPVKLRIKWLKEHFKSNPNIEVIYMNENKLQAFPAGLDKWSKAFKKLTKNEVNVKFADETYRKLNEEYFPECEFVCFDRYEIDVSGTKVRNNPKKYYDFIIDEAKPFFDEIIKNGPIVKNVVVKK